MGLIFFSSHLAALNIPAVAGTPSHNAESIASTAIFDRLVVKGLDWAVYQGDTPYSNEYFNFIKRPEILHPFSEAQSTVQYHYSIFDQELHLEYHFGCFFSWTLTRGEKYDVKHSK